MNAGRINQIKSTTDRLAKGADRILDGGENYDGADGAQYVRELCDYIYELIAALEAK